MLHQGTFPNCADLKYTAWDLTWEVWTNITTESCRTGLPSASGNLVDCYLCWSLHLWRPPRHIFGHLVVSEMCWAYFMVLKIKMNVAIWEIWLTPVRPVLESLKQESCHSCHTRASTLIWRSLEIKPPFTCLGRVYSVTQTGYLWSPCPPKNAVLKEKTKIFVSWKLMTPGS